MASRRGKYVDDESDSAIAEPDPNVDPAIFCLTRRGNCRRRKISGSCKAVRAADPGVVISGGMWAARGDYEVDDGPAGGIPGA